MTIITDLLTNLPANYLEALGKIGVRWNDLDEQAGMYIWVMADVGPLVGISITTHLGIRERLGALISLTELKTGQSRHTEEMKAISTRITETLLPKRNKYLHWPWSYQNDTWVQIKQQFRRGLTYEFEPRPISDLHDLITDLEKASEDLSLIFGNVLGVPTLKTFLEKLRRESRRDP